MKDFFSVDSRPPVPEVWTDEDHEAMFLWPESPQFESKLAPTVFPHEKIVKIAVHDYDTKVARCVR